MIRHTRAAGPGSRARTRQIGYAEAMADMARSIEAAARGWHDVEFDAASAGNMLLAEVIGSITAGMRERAGLADDLWALYADSRPPQDPRSFIGFEWENSEPPRELPPVQG